MSPSKDDLRRELKKRRAAVDTETAEAAARNITEHLRPLLRGATRVVGFSAIQNEVDLSEFYHELLESEVALCFPRVTGDGEMVFAPVDSLDDLKPGAFGIAEPSTEPTADSFDIVLVPALGFDHDGNRLGFGGGYYDRALTKLADVGAEVPLFIGIGYSCQVLDIQLPVDAWDVLVDSVVTENGVMTPARSK